MRLNTRFWLVCVSMTLLTLLGITLAFRGSTEAVVSVAGIIGMVATHAFKEVKD